MAASIVILALIFAYCGYVIRKGYKNMKEGKHTGCAGCSGSCMGCSSCGSVLGKEKKHRI